MRVAVITPYYNEPLDTLRRCHESVLAQTHPCTHFMIADGHPQPDVASWSIEHLTLPRSHRDYGNTPRCVGSISALNLGYDGIAFLDADNWYERDHVQSVVDACRETRAPVAASSRRIILPTGQEVSESRTEDSLGEHIDTSCLFITLGASFLLPVWGMMDRSLAAVGDRIIVGVAAKRKVPLVRTGRKTVNYQSTWAVHYQAVGLQPPPDAKYPPKNLGENYDEKRSTARLGFSLGLKIEPRT